MSEIVQFQPNFAPPASGEVLTQKLLRDGEMRRHQLGGARGRKSFLGLIAAAGMSMASPAMAAYTITFEQVGSSVVETGSGSLNVSGLTYTGNSFFDTPFASYVAPFAAQTFVGSGKVDIYAGVSGPTTFGPGGVTAAFGGQTGQGVSLHMQTQSILVPLGYISGTDLGLSTATYNNTDFTTLGLTPGTYLYSFGEGASADTFTVQIGDAAVPEPATWAMMLLGFGGIGFAMRRKHSQTLAVD